MKKCLAFVYEFSLRMDGILVYLVITMHLESEMKVIKNTLNLNENELNR